MNKLFNAENSRRQSELYNAYIESIEPVQEEHNEKLELLTKQYNESIKEFQDAYNLSIKPEYDEAAKEINPRTEKLKAKLEKIKNRATFQTNEALAKFSKWQDAYIAQLAPKIADRKDAFDAKIKPFEEYYLARTKAAQEAFELATRPQYDAYIEEAKKIEEEFSEALKLRATMSGTELNALYDEYGNPNEPASA